jgi:hypothetical protein
VAREESTGLEHLSMITRDFTSADTFALHLPRL